MYRGTFSLRAIGGALLRGSGRRELIVRANGRITYIPLSRLTQLAVVLVIGAVGAWVGHASYSTFALQRIIDGKDVEIAHAGARNNDLLAKMTEMRDQFSDVAGTLEHNHRDLVNLLSQNDVLKRDLGDVEQKLQSSETTRADGVRRRAELDGKFSRLKTQLAKFGDRNKRLSGSLKNTESELSDAVAARGRTDSARQTLKERVVGLERRLARFRRAQETLLNRATATAVKNLERTERVIARAGLNLGKLLGRAGKGRKGRGGPFIAAARAAVPGASFKDGVAIFDRHIERLRKVRGILRRLPLAAPLGRYRLSSRFGRRRDPINRKWARHEGVDLSGRLRSPVMATAPGKVIFAGWKGRYGRVVTIDHGGGIRTRYGHMRRIHVKKGQRVALGEMIGQLGNSGRSTGAHLHYEILVNGKAVDPMKFVKAGKDVFKG